MYHPQQRTLFSTLDQLVPKRLNLKHVAGTALVVFALYHFIIVHTLSAQEEPLPMNALLHQYPHPAPHRDLNDVWRYARNSTGKAPVPTVAPVIMYNHSGEYYSTPRYAENYIVPLFLSPLSSLLSLLLLRLGLVLSVLQSWATTPTISPPSGPLPHSASPRLSRYLSRSNTHPHPPAQHTHAL
eukprot:TRINITY_DN6750_c0_g1_i1.p1 TRINITY_DN6750_c0_g1~~TRINITY_DN6750_c0_g1_i1.p1  ORF type:complete len:184 (-),score=13.53 TRINITY_DN6750_c0_g1_i1:12-563(-)